jgi:hypothetical protein
VAAPPPRPPSAPASRAHPPPPPHQSSGWRKLGAAQGVSYEIRKNDIIYDERGDVSRADFTVRASLANGRFSDGWGACDR